MGFEVMDRNKISSGGVKKKKVTNHLFFLQPEAHPLEHLSPPPQTPQHEGNIGGLVRRQPYLPTPGGVAVMWLEPTT